MMYIGNNKYKVMVNDTKASFKLPAALPYDAEIEYLKSTGTQYINFTSFPQGKLVEMEVRFKAPASKFVLGRWQTTAAAYPAFGIDTYSNGRLFLSNTTTSDKYTKTGLWTSGTQDITISYSSGVLTVNNVQKDTGLDLSVNYPTEKSVAIFGLFTSKDAVNPTISSDIELKRIYFDTINDTIDLIPVRIGQIGFLYDKISGNLFGNSGTVDFVLGNDKT